jgi:iron complex transport system substrate-binding protein
MADNLGRAATFRDVVRIASLIPAGTDIAVALGLADSVVGVSHECDNPATAGRPVLTAANVAAAPLAPPGEVDRAVVDAVTAGEALYTTDIDLLCSLEPTVVLAQSVCDVCAVSGASVRDRLPATAHLVELTATTLAGLEDDLLRVGDACLAHDAAVGLVERVRAVRQEVTARTGPFPRRRVLTLEWGDPPFVGGHWVPELVAAAGGDHLLTQPGFPSVRSTWEQVAATAAEVVVFMPCGYRVDAAESEGQGLVAQVAGAEWWAVDAAALFSRCTPAAVTLGMQVLAGIIHPEACPGPAPQQARRLS